MLTYKKKSQRLIHTLRYQQNTSYLAKYVDWQRLTYVLQHWPASQKNKQKSTDHIMTDIAGKHLDKIHRHHQIWRVVRTRHLTSLRFKNKNWLRIWHILQHHLRRLQSLEAQNPMELTSPTVKHITKAINTTINAERCVLHNDIQSNSPTEKSAEPKYRTNKHKPE